ncbi:MAG: NADH-quinone oxidoreductase subunit NuoE [Acidobacteria bacterium]|nr:NADH-quinone oxidoreductase subunit NuoE [Acidobacteriota bacterium]
MALRRFDLEAGGDSFAFKSETEEKIAFWRAKYPADKQRSAVIPLLWLAQKDNNGWLSEPAMRAVADRLEMPYVRVYEVATFYTMFRLQPVGKFHIQLCGTTPCQLRGAEGLKEVCSKEIGKAMYVTDDKRLSWEEVECLGACTNAPMVQINDDFFEDLTPETLSGILSRLRHGADVTPGPQIDRINSAPEGGTTVLTEPSLFDGSRNSVRTLPNLPAAPAEAPASPEATGKPDAPAPTNKHREEPAPVNDKQDAAKTGSAADDLLQINGIGPKYAQLLNEMGVTRFAQIAAWNQETVDGMEKQLGFNDRIDREKWVAQAKLLAEGKVDEHAREFGRGKD